jgi:hypothetical protein
MRETAKSTAGPSTPFGAKNAPNSAQDDSFGKHDRLSMRQLLPTGLKMTGLPDGEPEEKSRV